MGEVLQKGTVFSQPKFLRKQPGFAHPTSRTDVLQVLMHLGNALVQRVVRGIRQYISFDMAPEMIHGIQLWACNRQDRKSTRLNSSHRCISYAVFCLKKKKT